VELVAPLPERKKQRLNPTPREYPGLKALEKEVEESAGSISMSVSVCSTNERF
jgi:hypothetical protein